MLEAYGLLGLGWKAWKTCLRRPPGKASRRPWEARLPVSRMRKIVLSWVGGEILKNVVYWNRWSYVWWVTGGILRHAVCEERRAGGLRRPSRRPGKPVLEASGPPGRHKLGRSRCTVIDGHTRGGHLKFGLYGASDGAAEYLEMQFAREGVLETRKGLLEGLGKPPGTAVPHA